VTKKGWAGQDELLEKSENAGGIIKKKKALRGGFFNVWHMRTDKLVLSCLV